MGLRKNEKSKRLQRDGEWGLGGTQHIDIKGRHTDEVNWCSGKLWSTATPYPDISLDEKLSQSASTIHFIMQDLQKIIYSLAV